MLRDGHKQSEAEIEIVEKSVSSTYIRIIDLVVETV